MKVSDRAWRGVFFIAAAFNIAAAAFFALAPDVALALFQFPPVTGQVVWYALFWWLVAAFGIGYYLVGRDLVANRSIALLGLVGKLGVVVVGAVLWGRGQLSSPMAALVAGDLVFSVFFLLFLSTHPATAHERAMGH
ncbi:MAG: hypothetical protein ACOY99_08435 [Pseudomonadota bacterium]